MRWGLGKLSKGVEADYDQTILSEILKVIKCFNGNSRRRSGKGEAEVWGFFFSLSYCRVLLEHIVEHLAFQYLNNMIV